MAEPFDCDVTSTHAARCFWLLSGRSCREAGAGYMITIRGGAWLHSLRPRTWTACIALLPQMREDLGEIYKGRLKGRRTMYSLIL